VRKMLAQLGRAILGGVGGTMPLPGLRDRDVFCFFATPDIGGAERIHAGIVEAIADRKPVVFFTEQPRDAGLIELYRAHAEVHLLAPQGRRRAREYLLEGRLAAAINRARDPVVFGAFSHFFYRLLPRLKSHVRAVDLIHNFGVGFESFSMQYVPRLDARVVIAEHFKDELAKLYDAFGLEEFAPRMRVIANAVEVPDTVPPKSDGPLRVLFVGRDSPEKRVHLVGRIAAALADEEIEFTLAGVTEDALPEATRPHCLCLGMIADAARLRELYEDSHMLILTSSREGLPVAMLEGMAHGVVPAMPEVGGIPEHLNASAGVLMPPEPEDALVEHAVVSLRRLAKSRAILDGMSAEVSAYARRHFGLEAFRREWRSVLLKEDT